MAHLKKRNAADYLVLAGLVFVIALIITAASVDASADEAERMMRNMCPPAAEQI